LRKQLGVGFIVLTLVTAVFVILPAGLLAFEMMRYNLMTQELRNVTDAAALAASATMASSPKELTLEKLHDMAIQSAAVTFEQNSVGSTRFSPDNVEIRPYELYADPPKFPHNAVVNIWLLDLNGNPQKRGSTLVKRVKVHALYKDTPAFTSFLSLQPTFTINAIAVGAIPQLDLMICFDLSGSMDDQTQAAVIERFWNGHPDPTKQMVEYRIQKQDTIYNLFAPPSTGTAVNAFWPQNLHYGAYSGQNANSKPWFWSEGYYPTPNKMNGLRAGFPAVQSPEPLFEPPEPPQVSFKTCEQGKPPGNFDPNNPANRKGNRVDPDAYPNGYTDLIVKVQDQDGFIYPDLETCLEASRGNLENKDVFNQSKGGAQFKTNPALQNVTPKHGYYINYWTQVHASQQPFTDARNALLKFIDNLGLTSDVHIGLETFADEAAEGRDDYWATTCSKIDKHYIYGGYDVYHIPLIGLNLRSSSIGDIHQAFLGTGFGNIDNIPDTHALPLGSTGRTNVGAALHQALIQLLDPDRSRIGAKKAIVLFTDGLANEPNDIQSASSLERKEARRAYDHGIPIYTIGLSQNPNIKPYQDAYLGDGNNGSGQGIAYLSGNHAFYVSVSEGKDLNQAFNAVGRNLAKLCPAN
jgi:hypothetical protein